MWLISQTLPVQAGCICNTAWSRSADRGLHMVSNNKHTVGHRRKHETRLDFQSL